MSFKRTIEKDPSSVRGYKAEDYKKGSPEFNLLLNERRLLLRAILSTKWDIDKAMELNYPEGGIEKNGYNRKLLDHGIRVGKKTYNKIKIE